MEIANLQTVLQWNLKKLQVSNTGVMTTFIQVFKQIYVQKTWNESSDLFHKQYTQ